MRTSPKPFISWLDRLPDLNFKKSATTSMTPSSPTHCGVLHLGQSLWEASTSTMMLKGGPWGDLVAGRIERKIGPSGVEIPFVGKMTCNQIRKFTLHKNWYKKYWENTFPDIALFRNMFKFDIIGIWQKKKNNYVQYLLSVIITGKCTFNSGSTDPYESGRDMRREANGRHDNSFTPWYCL